MPSSVFKHGALDALARKHVGDGKRPNMYFVTRGVHVEMVTCDGDAAHAYWQTIPHNVESALEDRLVGTLASTEPVEEGSTELVSYDDFDHFSRRRT